MYKSQVCILIKTSTDAEDAVQKVDLKFLEQELKTKNKNITVPLCDGDLTLKRLYSFKTGKDEF